MFAVPIELPEVPVPELIQEVNIHDPVNDDDLAEAQLYLTRLVRRRLENDINVSNAQVANAARFSHQVAQALHPAETAPVYFQAFAAQLTLQLGQVSAQVQQLSTQVAQIGPLRAEVQQLSTQVAQIGPLRAEVANMRVEFSSAIRNSNAMSFNRGVVLPGHALQPLVTRAGEVPADFPATRADLRNLQGQVCSHLLIAYEQPVPDAVWARKEALSNFIGTPPV